jgi:hypothetical protein
MQLSKRLLVDHQKNIHALSTDDGFYIVKNEHCHGATSKPPKIGAYLLIG